MPQPKAWLSFVLAGLVLSRDGIQQEATKSSIDSYSYYLTK